MEIDRNDLVKLKFTGLAGAVTKVLDWVNTKNIREVYGYEVIYFNNQTGKYETVSLPKTLVEAMTKDKP